MKILQLIQKPQLRGAEIFACQLSNELLKKKIEVVIVTLFQGDVVLPFEGRMIQLNLPQNKKMFDIKGWKLLAEIITRENPNIIQANAGDTLKYAVISRMIFKWKGVLVFRNASTVSLYIKSSLQRWLNSRFYKHVDHVISVSEYTKHDLVKLFPFLKSKISVVPIGIMPRESAYQSRPEGQIILLHVGGFTFEKNHLGLIRIFESFKKLQPNSVLWLVGDGPLRPSVEQYVASKNLSTYVKFWGYQANPFAFVNSCDVFLLPSILEGLPGVILEAFFCKAPVIAYNVGAVSEIVKTNETGWLIEKGNETDFLNAIETVVTKSELRMLVVRQAHTFVVGNYLIEKVSDKFIDLYKNLLNE